MGRKEGTKDVHIHVHVYTNVQNVHIHVHVHVYMHIQCILYDVSSIWLKVIDPARKEDELSSCRKEERV